MTFDPHTPATVLSLINSTVSSAKTALELAKSSKDSSLKQTISEVFDGILELKRTVFDLEEDNRNLKRQLSASKDIHRDGSFGYWFKKDELEPLCPKCYEGDNKLVYLPPSEPWNGGIRRDCRVCGDTTWEVSMNLNSSRIVPRR